MDLVMVHLKGILNPSNGMTKPLGWVLHSRHARRGMGHYNKIGSPSRLPPLQLSPSARLEGLEAGEGVGARQGRLRWHP